jgi:hypothetical protein
LVMRGCPFFIPGRGRQDSGGDFVLPPGGVVNFNLGLSGYCSLGHPAFNYFSDLNYSLPHA